MWYKNVGTSFLRFVTIRQTQTRVYRNALARLEWNVANLKYLSARKVENFL